jgi:DNA-binding MarR family transcriptional regulator
MENTTDSFSRDIEVASHLRITIHRLVKLLRRQTNNDSELSLTERSTMGSLYNHGELLSSALAQMEKVTTQSMSQIINHLYEQNYIHKTPSEEDKRKVLLSLTAEGRTLVEDSRQRKQEWLAHSLREKVSPAEKDLLMEALKIMTKLIDE